MHRGGDSPVRIAQLKLTLQPLKFMEFSMEDPLMLVLPASSGPVVCHVPQPQRYALAKLIVHIERQSSSPSKSIKDLEQAATLIDYLSRYQEEVLQEAWTDLLARGPGWRTRALEGLRSLRQRHQDIECAITDA